MQDFMTEHLGILIYSFLAIMGLTIVLFMYIIIRRAIENRGKVPDEFHQKIHNEILAKMRPVYQVLLLLLAAMSQMMTPEHFYKVCSHIPLAVLGVGFLESFLIKKMIKRYVGE